MAIRRGARGFTLPLTLVLCFSLMTLASVVVGAIVTSAAAARSAEHDLFALVTLESAVQSGLAGLERDGAPQATRWIDRASVNGRSVQLDFSNQAFEPDVNTDPDDRVAAGIADAALHARVVRALAATPPVPGGFRFQRLQQLVAASKAGAAEEDCLRRAVTIGRKGPRRTDEPDPLAPVLDQAPLKANDVFEVRAELDLPPRDHEVLWTRVRYTGRPEHPWLTHDWRKLLLSAPLRCPRPPRA